MGGAATGDLAPLLSGKYLAQAEAAYERGAVLLVDAALRRDARVARLGGWVHAHAAWAMASVLESLSSVEDAAPRMGKAVKLDDHVVLGPGVVVGDRVTVGASSVIGGQGFGWAEGPGGQRKRIVHLGGVILEDDVTLGPLCTVDAGVLAPTVVRRGASLDAHVHVGHNCDIGEGVLIAAQCGFAGSVRIGRGARIGGQVGVADHVVIGEGARIAAKSGVIGDVPPGATYAGYPALPRARWLRGLASLFRRV